MTAAQLEQLLAHFSEINITLQSFGVSYHNCAIPNNPGE